MDPVAVAAALHEEAEAVDERRMLVLSGDRDGGYEALESILGTLAVPITETTLVGPDDRLRCPRVPVRNADRLLGTTRQVVVLDAHEEFRPNALGSVVGAVDGGGLLVLLTPALAAWPDRRDGFDESLAVPPFGVEDVTGRFRMRLVETLRAHRGIALIDIDGGRVESDGLTRPAPRLRRGGSNSESGPGCNFAAEAELDPAARRPTESQFPPDAYEACLTVDQAEAVAAFEGFLDADSTGEGGPESATEDGAESTAHAVVLESDRGRGKSSAAGLAAGALAARGRDVLVTAPTYGNASEVFERATELLASLGQKESDGDGGADASGDGAANGAAIEGDSRTIESRTGGRVRYLPPEKAADAVDAVDAADVLIVDEAAALPVAILAKTLAADRVAYATTVHGYEGAGRSFSVRFRDRLADARHRVVERSLAEPIRYAAGDPVETWAFRALLLDAGPAVDPLVADAGIESIAYGRPTADDLLADERRLREVFGLLVLAHYRTEPNDLARVLDAPNLVVRTLEYEGHVVSVALLAREGGLSAETRAEMYAGARIRGNMLPDVLTSQLRDELAGDPVGYRVVRIATHHAVRSRGLGSELLARVREEFAAEVDWLGTGFGATPELLSFWRRNGFGTVHCSTTRNDRSGEHSAIMLSPTSDAGRDLRKRHARWFARRLPAVCSDSLSNLDVDVVRALVRSVPTEVAPTLDLTDHEWRVVAGAAYGPGLLDVDPGPFRRLVVHSLLDVEGPEIGLTDREERLLVSRCLQARTWPTVAEELGYHSTGQCMRAGGAAVTKLVDRYGVDAEAARAVRERFDDA